MFTSTTFEKIICVQLFDVIERAWKQEKQRQFSTKANKYDTLITVHTHIHIHRSGVLQQNIPNKWIAAVLTPAKTVFNVLISLVNYLAMCSSEPRFIIQHTFCTSDRLGFGQIKGSPKNRNKTYKYESVIIEKKWLETKLYNTSRLIFSAFLHLPIFVAQF